MTPEERLTLVNFRTSNRFANGNLIDWSTMSYSTMQEIDRVAARLRAAIVLIRGNHGPDGSAIDWTCPGVPYARVVMESIRARCSFGLYSGMSVHYDTRPLQAGQLPAQWLAVHDDEEQYLTGGTRKLIYRRADGWLYLLWSEPDGLAFQALQIVVGLAEARRRRQERPTAT